MQQVLDTLIEQVHAARATHRTLRIRGGGSKDFYGNRAQGDELNTAAYSGVVAYDAAELVFTARAGTALQEVESVLSASGQMLAFDPPHFALAATLGGAIASGLSGPRRAANGAARDFVLGVRMIDGRGEDLRFGGQVLKNVAGYDVSRFMAGSMGTLGVLLEVSLKVLPKPVSDVTVALEMPHDVALRRCNQWAGKPLPISATCHHGDMLWLRLSGAANAVRSAREKLGGELLEDGTAFWQSIREQTHDYFGAEEALWRFSLPSTAAPLELPGESLIEWGGAQRWIKTGADTASLRAAATKAGGHATLFRRKPADSGDEPVFQPMAPAIAALHGRLKLAFDPHGIFDSGRLFRTK